MARSMADRRRAAMAPREPVRPSLPPDRAPVDPSADELADGLQGALLRDATLGGARLGSLGMLDCVLEHCDLAALEASGASLARVALTGSRLTGVVATEARLKDVSLIDCRLNLALLHDARLERVTFERCDLREADLEGARLHDVRFVGCDLSEASVRGADCSRVELRDCRYEGLRGVESLRGVAVAWPDALALAGQFAAALGVRVLEEE
jgi:uncharacterized protein YjbI with pentapeptide repeats